MTTNPPSSPALTQFSHGAGCGCKIAPAVLEKILSGITQSSKWHGLLVGNESKDDAAVLDLGNGTALISTTDFFMPVVDDAFDFGRIAAANAISDIYAMGGQPILAISILGWPINKLAPEIAKRVMEGAINVCTDAGIPLAGGHSIDSPEPIFGLAVNGIVPISDIKRNNTSIEGDLLFLTKPLGIGIITTAQKKGILEENDLQQAVKQMCTLNKLGISLGKLKSVHALTDVTGFGLAGHALEMAEGSNVTVELFADTIPVIKGIDNYIAKKCFPGGTTRNFDSYGHKIFGLSENLIPILCDPQTSGGLLVSISPEIAEIFKSICRENHVDEICFKPVGRVVEKRVKSVVVIYSC
ncbi:MAG: selenide, water dikinase SelD [Bacteroidetes bacterium RIFCSPLOWO2_02_FULL_36_8]|nr:MAG: selenide, water dikinase SelD [Bacteroidetes bacterium RIFCSPLOWO2_02_FULL_36_8]OFY72079.1 MAG: selenide, water dikinase SelD [Bacteroidetes bacterium RIFCSPLOWO2_12_FULL_37_12]